MNENKIEDIEIMGFIQEGFLPEIIAFELDIPAERMARIQQQLKEEAVQQVSTKMSKKKKKQQQEEIQPEEQLYQRDYTKVIAGYQQEIEEDPRNINKRNLLAFAYWKSGDLETAKKELQKLIEETGSITAYRQIIYLEKEQGNWEDAQLWAYEAMERFPDNETIRKQVHFLEQQTGEER